MSGKEGNIISFQVLVDKKGNLVTEYRHVPISEVSRVFDKHDTPLVQKIIREISPKLEVLHEHLEKELNALTSSGYLS
tara:strand:- start:864 stop:1097 length:234 start_codon:yes stop_codon:yes gene_type:complete